MKCLRGHFGTLEEFKDVRREGFAGSTWKYETKLRVQLRGESAQSTSEWCSVHNQGLDWTFLMDLDEIVKIQLDIIE